MLLIFAQEETGRICSILLTAVILGEGNTCDFHFLNIPIVFELLKIDTHYLGKKTKNKDLGGKSDADHS